MALIFEFHLSQYSSLLQRDSQVCQFYLTWKSWLKSQSSSNLKHTQNKVERQQEQTDRNNTFLLKVPLLNQYKACYRGSLRDSHYSFVIVYDRDSP